MRYLLISCCFLMVSCGSYSKKHQLTEREISNKFITNPYFSDTSQDFVYKANIQVYDNNFGGLLIIKKIEDGNHRVVFTTEMGAKLFDFSITETNFKVNYILDDLNKKLLINLLKTDFKALVQERNLVSRRYIKDSFDIYKTTILGKSHFYYVSDQLDQIIRTGHRKEKVHFLFTDINNNIANHIIIKHHNINLQIALKSIQ
ncbi:hypothetical protein SAMN04487989_101842 [Bizionia echini]|uniref:DUF4292 domain-containing protein n=1 Tax=Bizionia echini TaxID=649333 RepID=A0A1I4ZIZ1_9FLAO|nr:hypothetical protein [Bizionia echini]SFN49890.1 hypothetical protein SAMN04487989_101842 [Bizionia echini]